MQTIIKRDGSKEEFDISKIRKVINFACEGLDINPLHLEASITKKFKNNTSTEEIQKELIIVATSLATIDEPDWINVAGRLVIYNLQRDVFKKHKIDYTTDYYEVVSYMCRNGYYDNDILKYYTKEEISSLTKHINPDLDKNNTIGSAISLQSKYLIKNAKGVVELPQHSNMAVALFLNKYEDSSNRLKSVIEDYKMIAEKTISIATPFKANLRKPGGNLSSCFIVEADDNIESIMKIIKDVALISKNGGGVGIYLGKVRPSNSLIRGLPVANNICSWVKIINDTIVSCNQLGQRCHHMNSVVRKYDNKTKMIHEAPIATIKPNDLIESFNHKTNANEFKRVKEVIVSKIPLEDQYEVFTEKSRVIVSADTKLFVVEDSTKLGYYTKVKDIMSSFKYPCIQYLDGTFSNNLIVRKYEIKNVDMMSKHFVDFEVEDNHNFYVKIRDEKEFLLSHNSGAATVAIDIWHKDLLDFIKIKKEEDGDLRLKAFDIFPQVVLNNIFIKRLKEDKDWYLLDHTEILRKLKIDITKVGELEKHFNTIEEAVLNKKLTNCITIPSKKLWKEMLVVYIETGDLYMSHKDNANKDNPVLQNDNEIHSFNLCLESIGPIASSKNYNMSNENGITNESYTTGYYHCCNLSAINLSVILNDEKLLEKACRKAVRMLDKSIELTKAPTTEADNYNKLFRNINVTDLGLADWMAYNKLSYHKEEDWEQVLALYERIAYYTLDESCNIAQEKGPFELFDKSYFTKGIMIGKTPEELTETSRNKGKLDWFALSEKVKKGVRNLMLRAIAPNTSCQDGNNKIMTKNGNMSVYDILRKEGLDINEIESKEPFWIKLNNPIQIPTSEGDDVVEKIWWNGCQEYIEIEFEDGKKYKFTYNHKLLVLRENGFTEWVECRNLSDGDEILDINHVGV